MWPFRRTATLMESALFMGMVDCHSHLLPGVDDGVQTLEDSLQLLHQIEQLGVRRVWLTPHVMEDIPNETLSLQKHFQTLKEIYQGRVEIQLAAEYMLDNLFEERLENNDLLPLEEGKRYLLVETSYFNPPMGLLSTLQRIQQKGYYPLLAHPERYKYMEQKDYRKLKQESIYFQLNLPSLVGMYGKQVQEKAEALLKAGLYEQLGCDTHSAVFYENLLEAKISKSTMELLSGLMS